MDQYFNPVFTDQHVPQQRRSQASAETDVNSGLDFGLGDTTIYDAQAMGNMEKQNASDPLERQSQQSQRQEGTLQNQDIMEFSGSGSGSMMDNFQFNPSAVDQASMIAMFNAGVGMGMANQQMMNMSQYGDSTSSFSSPMYQQSLQGNMNMSPFMQQNAPMGINYNDPQTMAAIMHVFSMMPQAQFPTSMMSGMQNNFSTNNFSMSQVANRNRNFDGTGNMTGQKDQNQQDDNCNFQTSGQMQMPSRRTSFQSQRSSMQVQPSSGSQYQPNTQQMQSQMQQSMNQQMQQPSMNMNQFRSNSSGNQQSQSNSNYEQSSRPQSQSCKSSQMGNNDMISNNNDNSKNNNSALNNNRNNSSSNNNNNNTSTKISGWPEGAEGGSTSMTGDSVGPQTQQYENAYSSTGFDMLTVLMRVATRKNPEINIGAVDLSCAFVVCDAFDHDIPIVYCSENFERLTGYTKHEILGRNCRFLQAPDGRVQAGVKREYVDDDSVLYLKNRVNARGEAQVSLINYRKGGQPFMNLLTIIPIAYDSDETRFYVGFQVDLVEQPNSVTSKNPGKL